jgi:hypothetical protein
MSFTEDLTPFFNTSEFADTATIGVAVVRGILVPGYESATLEGFGVAAGTSPEFHLPCSEVPSKAEGKQLIVTTGAGAGSYRIGNVEPDGTGVCILKLIQI